MKDRRKRASLLLISRCALALLFFSGFTFSTLRLIFSESYHPNLISSWRTSPAEAIYSDSPAARGLSVGETVLFPDQVLVFLKYPPSSRLLTKDEIECVYYSPNTSRPHRRSSPLSIGGQYLDHQIVRCDVPPRGTIVSVGLKAQGDLPPGPTHEWKSLAYEAMIDRDNTTIVFVKGLNLRSGRASNASRFQCVYGSDFTNRKLQLRSQVVSIAQEIVRCRTPSSLLETPHTSGSIKVSVNVIGKGILSSIARPEFLSAPDPDPDPDPYPYPPVFIQHRVCICTMIRNQARFLPEWVMYHARIGVEHWFIYDNNSDDEIEDVIDSLTNQGFEISRHLWPWIKTQEAGFAHCALRARDFCEWVAFIDVDEFLHLRAGVHLGNIIRNLTSRPDVAELRISCHNFGPSGLKDIPPEGVMVGYTCRLGLPERHKSIVQPEKLNPTLINMVHHFHLRDGLNYVNVDRNLMVINHYKFQVWDVFKEKFYRRVSTYVSDWQKEENAGSKDRAPGLGTRAIEPADWSSRFCEIKDTGLRDWVVKTFSDPNTGLLPWQQERVL